MAILDKNGYDYNKSWAAETPNVNQLTEYDRDMGILYRSEIISAQVNGALQHISNGTRWAMYGAGYYTPNTTYDIGNICKIAFKMGNGKFYLAEFICKNQVVNVCPVKDLTPLYFDCGFMYFEIQDFNVLRTKVADGWEVMDYFIAYLEGMIADFQKQITKQLEDTKNEIINKLTPTWYNFGSIKGGSWDLNLAIGNDQYNNFLVTCTANVSLRNIIITGATEKSGLLIFLNGFNYVTGMFSDVKAVYTFDVPYPTPPYNTGEGKTYIGMPYYFTPKAGNKVFFTRI